MSLYLPDNYSNVLGNAENTEKAIKAVKDMFQINLSAQLTLLRVTAPMVHRTIRGQQTMTTGVLQTVMATTDSTETSSFGIL